MARPALLLALTLLALPAGAAPHAHDACPDAVTPQPFLRLDAWIENLHFHAGRLYTAGDGGLRVHDTEGGTEEVDSLGGTGGAMVTGMDGALYVRAGVAEVWRFGPEGPVEVVARDLPGANGLAVDADGNLYVSSTGADRIYRLPAADPAAWTEWAEVYSPNGLVVDDAARILYTAQTTDGRSTIAAIPLDDPHGVRIVSSLSFGAAQLDLFDRPPILRPVAPSDPGQPVLPKGLDDLALGADGMLYVTAFLTGEVLRVDPATGAACAVSRGLGGPTSVRVARGFGPLDGALFVSEAGSTFEFISPVRNPAGPGGVSILPLQVGAPPATRTADGLAAQEEARATPLPAAAAVLALALALALRRRDGA